MSCAQRYPCGAHKWQVFNLHPKEGSNCLGLHTAAHPPVLMAVAAARLSYHLPSNVKSESFSPRLRLQPFKTLQRGPLSSVGPIFSSLVKQDQSLSFTEPEAALIEALLGIQGRGRAASPQQVKDVEDAVQVLEDLKGLPDPTGSNLIEGRWQLIFTTRPGTASPIQRTFVGVDFFKVFQEVFLRADDQRVSNIVKFSEAIGELKVEAAATIEDGKRILFQFDCAAFSFKFLPFKVPYPVPFRLLGDEAKGWLDTTYLSSTGNLRISRGNKGTIFVLQKRLEERQRLLEAISNESGVTEVIDELISLRKKKDGKYLSVADLMRQVIDRLISLRMKKDEKYDETLEGEWELVWTSESEEKSWEVIVADGLKGKQIVRENGQLENYVDRFPGFRYCASGNLIKTSDSKTYTVSMVTGYVLVGGFKSPVEIESSYTMELLYIDNKIRITRGNKNTMFIHLRLDRN